MEPGILAFLKPLRECKGFRVEGLRVEGLGRLGFRV